MEVVTIAVGYTLHYAEEIYQSRTGGPGMTDDTEGSIKIIAFVRFLSVLIKPVFL